MSGSAPADDARRGRGIVGAAGWLEDAIQAPPVARRGFRVFAGVLVALGLSIVGLDFWRHGAHSSVIAFATATDVLVAVGVIVLLLLFTAVTLTGRVPLRLWRLYLRVCGRL